LTLAWPSTRQQFRDFFRGMVWELTLGLVFGLAFGLFVWLVFGLAVAVVLGVVLGVAYGLLEGLTSQLLKPWFVVITSLTPKDTRLRSLITALIYGLVSGLVSALFFGVFIGLLRGLIRGLFGGVIVALQVGIFVGLNHGGWFVLLQKVAHRRLRRADTLPPQPDDFLEWGIETQIFRRVGGGVRFRHNLIQQHLANISVATL
jgi:hypothetical protein